MGHRAGVSPCVCRGGCLSNQAPAVLLSALIAASAAAVPVPDANPGATGTPASSSAQTSLVLSREEIRAAAAKLKTDPNLGGEKKIRTLRWSQTKADAPLKVNAPAAWLSGLFEFLGQSASALLWVTGVIAAAIAVVWVIRTLGSRSTAVKEHFWPSVSRVAELDIRPDSLPEDVGAAALALLEAGRTREALSLLYRGALSRAVHRFGVTIGESYTEGEALEAVRARLDAPQAHYFSSLIDVWQRAVYAGETVQREPIVQLCRSFLPTLDEVIAA
jgi:Domain of unknown function (DUF4129)